MKIVHVDDSFDWRVTVAAFLADEGFEVVSCSSLQDASLHIPFADAIIVDGKVVAAVEEERFTRVKHWAGFPAKSIEYCLNCAGIDLEGVDCIAINRDPMACIGKKIGFVIRNLTPWSFLSDRLRNRGKLLGIDGSLAEIFGGNTVTY